MESRVLSHPSTLRVAIRYPAPQDPTVPPPSMFQRGAERDPDTDDAAGLLNLPRRYVDRLFDAGH
jgi:hypothetical protein